MPPVGEEGAISPLEFGRFMGRVDTGLDGLKSGQKKLHERIDDCVGRVDDVRKELSKDINGVAEKFAVEMAAARHELSTHINNHPTGTPPSNGRLGKYKGHVQTGGTAAGLLAILEVARYFMQ